MIEAMDSRLSEHVPFSLRTMCHQEGSLPLTKQGDVITGIFSAKLQHAVITEKNYGVPVTHYTLGWLCAVKLAFHRYYILCSKPWNRHKKVRH